MLMLVMMMFVYHMQCFFVFRCKGTHPGMQPGCKKKQQDLLLLSCVVKASPA
jgi:hypothetical protein